MRLWSEVVSLTKHYMLAWPSETLVSPFCDPLRLLSACPCPAVLGPACGHMVCMKRSGRGPEIQLFGAAPAQPGIRFVPHCSALLAMVVASCIHR